MICEQNVFMDSLLIWPWVISLASQMVDGMLLFSQTVVSNSLWPNGLQHTSPSPSPIACSNSCPLNRWCRPIISSSVIPFSSCLRSFQHQSLFKRVSSSHQVAKALEFQLQHKTLVVYRFIKLCIYSYIHFPWKWVTSLELKGTYSKVKGKLLVTMWSWQ